MIHIEGQGHTIPIEVDQDHLIMSEVVQGHMIIAEVGQGHMIIVEVGQGHIIIAEVGQGHQIQKEAHHLLDLQFLYVAIPDPFQEVGQDHQTIQLEVGHCHLYILM
jgi:oxalate decarboxylase/phosphoglucose isomerase-like protein (cupin superfamily)